MWDFIVLVPDHFLSFYFVCRVGIRSCPFSLPLVVGVAPRYM